MEGEIAAVQVSRISMSLLCTSFVWRRIVRHTCFVEALLIDMPLSLYSQKEAEVKMKKSVDSCENNLKGIRTGRAS